MQNTKQKATTTTTAKINSQFAKYAKVTLPKGAVQMPMPVLTQNKFTPVNNAYITAWVNGLTNGNVNNVYCYPLANVPMLTNISKGNTPVPFGYGSKKPASYGGTSYYGGQRGAMQTLNLYGVPVQGGGVTFSLTAINTCHQAIAKAAKYSHQLNYVTLGLLNGGYSASSKNWGTSYVALVHVGK